MEQAKQEHPKALNKFRGLTILKEDKKLCQMCSEWKDLLDYNKRLDRPIGIRAKCKDCEKVYRKKNIFSQKLTEYKSGAKRRGIDWRLSKEQFLSFWKKSCFYCNDYIDTVGIDRIDNDDCYRIGNVVSCCEFCNRMKMAIPKDIFLNHCRKIMNNFPN